MRTLAGATVFVIGATGVASADAHAPIGDAISELPLFDAHIHYKEPAWDAYGVGYRHTDGSLWCGDGVGVVYT